MDAAASAAIALQKAQATQIYAGLNLWPASVTAKLAQAQLAEDGTYPGAERIFTEVSPAQPMADAFPVRSGFDPTEPREPNGRWTEGGGGGERNPSEADLGGAASAPPENAPTWQAPDGTPIEVAAFRKKGGRGQGLAIATLLGAVARAMRRWLPKLPDDDEPDLPPQPGPRDLPSSPSPRSSQTEKNKKAQSIDPRIRSDLDDRFINDDGTLKWPDNNGADGLETPPALQPGQIVDKYGYPNGEYLSPTGTPFNARSLPYEETRTPLQIYRVKRLFIVQQSRIAPWFDEPGGGVQLRTGHKIKELLDQKYIEPMEVDQ